MNLNPDDAPVLPAVDAGSGADVPPIGPGPVTFKKASQKIRLRRVISKQQAEIDRLQIELVAARAGGASPEFEAVRAERDQAAKERDTLAELLSEALINLDLWRRKYPSNTER